MFRKLAVAFSLVCSVGTSAAFAAGRVDVPIGQLVLPNGETRYFVPVSIGGAAPIDALLDTGSAGLRVLKSALKPDQYEATGVRRSRPFASGTRFEGTLGLATLDVGGARSDRKVTIHVIDKFACVERKPHCAASKMKAEDFRMAGDGYPNRGFQAILGVSMRKAPVPDVEENPLPTMGDGSWIIVLPQPHSAEPGHLIINPTAEDRTGFATVRLSPQRGGRGRGGPEMGDMDDPGLGGPGMGGPGMGGPGGGPYGARADRRAAMDPADMDPADMGPGEDGPRGMPRANMGPAGAPGGVGWMDGALDGCLVDLASKQTLCGKTLIDTGAPGFSVDSASASERSQWKQGTPVKFELAGADQPIAFDFTTGEERSHRVRVRPARNPDLLRIAAGTLPYFFYDILYDAKVGTIGFKPRSR